MRVKCRLKAEANPRSYFTTGIQAGHPENTDHRQVTACLRSAILKLGKQSVQGGIVSKVQASKFQSFFADEEKAPTILIAGCVGALVAGLVVAVSAILFMR